MIFDDEMLMAFADGELDLITAKRVEKAIASDPAVAERVAAHLLLRTTMAAAFPLDPRPDPLAAMIGANIVVKMPKRVTPSRPRWLQAAALAACLVAGVAVGTRWQGGRVSYSSGGTLVASGQLAHALDTQLASTPGDTRMLVSFRNKSGHYCRVFEGRATDGIACRNADVWQLVSTQSGDKRDNMAYRQAGSAKIALMRDAQEMMAGAPSTEADEIRARALMWSVKK